MSTTPDSAVMTPLARLLQERMDENGWLLRDVTRPPDGNRQGAPARSTMSQHLQPNYWLQTMPRPKTIDELAVAVRLSPDQIREAAWQSMDANRHANHDGKNADQMRGRPRADRDVLELHNLTEEQRLQLRQLAELFRAQNPQATT